MSRIAVYLGLFAFLFSVSCATVETGDRIQQASAHYKIGVTYLNDNKIQMAFVEFHKAYDLDPNNKDVLNAIGIIYLINFDEPLKAADYFQKAVKADPDFSEAYNNLGYANEKLGRFEAAITYYRKALSNPLYPTAEKAYLNMGNSYYRLGRYAEATSAVKEALKRAPNLWPAYMRLALCYNAAGKYGDAATAMSQAIKLNPAYNGSREKAADDLRVRQLGATGYEERDIRDYLEILKY